MSCPRLQLSQEISLNCGFKKAQGEIDAAAVILVACSVMQYHLRPQGRLQWQSGAVRVFACLIHRQKKKQINLRSIFYLFMESCSSKQLHIRTVILVDTSRFPRNLLTRHEDQMCDSQDMQSCIARIIKQCYLSDVSIGVGADCLFTWRPFSQFLYCHWGGFNTVYSYDYHVIAIKIFYNMALS